MVCHRGMSQFAESGATDFRHPARWSLLSAGLRWGASVVVLGLALLVQTAGAATAPSDAHGGPVR